MTPDDIEPKAANDMTVSWRFRLVRVQDSDLQRQQELVLDGLFHGWMLDAQAATGDGTVDLVFRRATASEHRWPQL